MLRRSLICLSGIVCLLIASGALAQPFVWREAETPDQSNFELKIDQGPHGELLSGGAWLNAGLSKEDVQAGKVGEGRKLAYDLDLPQAGAYRLWIRLGFEFARAPLRWRIDQGEWQDLTSETLSTNLIGLAT